MGLVHGQGHGEAKKDCVAQDQAHVRLVLDLEDANFLVARCQRPVRFLDYCKNVIKIALINNVYVIFVTTIKPRSI